MAQDNGPTPSRWTSALPPMGLFVGVLVLYLSNGDFLAIGDAMPNAFGAARILRSGAPTFTPEDSPSMFVWVAKTSMGDLQARVLRWDQPLGPQSARQWKDAGLLTPQSAEYYLWPTRKPGVYAGIYGPAPAFSALPVFLVAAIVVDDLPAHPPAVFYTAKIAAAALAAASAVFVFLASRRLAGRGAALAVAFSYALGTSIWSEASQCLWQQTTHLFFLSLGAWLLVDLFQGRRVAWAVGIAFAVAAATRPTGLFALAAVTGLIAFRRRPDLRRFAAGAAGVLIAAAIVQSVLFGTPWPGGQMESAKLAALRATGVADVWQTPFFTGAFGMLLSPSRGLLLLSPVLAFSGWGAWKTWKEDAFLPLRPLTVAVAAMMLVSFKWYLWWGGPCFGPRMLMDTLPFLALLLAPVADAILQRPMLRIAAAVLLAWSVTVHFAGAFAFEPSMWNARVSGYEVSTPRGRVGTYPDLAKAEAVARQTPNASLTEIREDVTEPAHRGRLWSLTDNQPLYFLAHFTEARETRRKKIDAMLRLY